MLAHGQALFGCGEEVGISLVAVDDLDVVKLLGSEVGAG